MPAGDVTTRFAALAELVLQPSCSTAVSRDSPWHGPDHWRVVCVLARELILAVTDADPEVALCFGLLHDTQRVNDDHDPGHGPRAAARARRLHADGRLPLSHAQLDVLTDAIARHDQGHITSDPTIGVCWDADRLTLPRVGITPDPRYLSTAQGRTPAMMTRALEWLDAPPPDFGAVLRRYDAGR